METEKFTSPQNDAENVADSLRKIRRGAEPIPGCLPLVGVGIPGAKKHYLEEDLSRLREMGLNTMMADFYVAMNQESSDGFIPTFTPDLSNITISLENGKKTGMRLIPGLTLIDPALSGMNPPASQDTEAVEHLKRCTGWKSLVEENTDSKGCPAWYLSEEPSVAEIGGTAVMCRTILNSDVWNKPILFRLKPSTSSVAEITGGTVSDWTAGTAFSRYRTLLDSECPPSVWWVTDRAFTKLYSDTSSMPSPRYLKALKDVQEHIRPDALNLTPRYNSMWATVHCSFPIPEEHLGKEEKDIPDEYLELMRLRMGLEARCALALGAKGLIFDRLCGLKPADEWCPGREITRDTAPGEDNAVWTEVGNPLGNILSDLTSGIQEMADVFIVHVGQGSLRRLSDRR